jgi:uncharacterized protein YndB with AHSA1/START domain
MSNDNQDLVITRVFDAPLEKVWECFSDSAHLSQWWGPKHFHVLYANMVAMPEGEFFYIMNSPDGKEICGKWVFREFVNQKKLLFVSSFADNDGNIIRNPMSVTWPLEIINDLTFVELDGKTNLTFRAEPINASEEERATFQNARELVKQGFEGTWKQLDAYLLNMLELN